MLKVIPMNFMLKNKCKSQQRWKQVLTNIPQLCSTQTCRDGVLSNPRLTVHFCVLPKPDLTWSASSSSFSSFSLCSSAVAASAKPCLCSPWMNAYVWVVSISSRKATTTAALCLKCRFSKCLWFGGERFLRYEDQSFLISKYYSVERQVSYFVNKKN